jgi:hypothetical protein
MIFARLLLPVLLAATCVHCGPGGPEAPAGTRVCEVHGVDLIPGYGAPPPEPPLSPQYRTFMEQRGHDFPNAHGIALLPESQAAGRYTEPVDYCEECREALDLHFLEAFS